MSRGLGKVNGQWHTENSKVVIFIQDLQDKVNGTKNNKQARLCELVILPHKVNGLNTLNIFYWSDKKSSLYVSALKWSA